MHRCFGLLCVSAALASAMVAAAEKTQSIQQPQIRSVTANDVGKTKKPKAITVFTSAREAAAMAFVGRHHPELADLLATLKKTEAGEYQRAIGALFRAGERLAQIQERNPEHYQRELKAWKLKSRIQLLVAQLRITPEDKKLRRELKQSLTAQADLRREQLVEDRKRLTERLERLDGLIKRTQEERDSQIEKQIELLLRSKVKRGVTSKKSRERTSDAPHQSPRKPPTQPAR